MASGIWELLFKYPPLVFEKGRLAFASPLPWWLLLAALAAATAALWSYGRARRGLAPRDRAVLVAIRAGMLGLLLLALFRPTLQVPTAVPRENYLAVLIDDSRSMRIADGRSGARGEEMRQALEAQVLRELGERFRVRLFRFSGSAERLDDVASLSFQGGRTRMGRALDQVRSELAGVPLAGIVVLTDGGDQSEAELDASVLGLRTAAIPLYTVGIGRESGHRDVEIRRVAAPRTVLRGSSLVVDVVIAQSGYRGQRVPLIVEDEGRVVGTQEVDLPMDGTPAAVRVHFQATEPGWRRFRFRVPLQEGELIRENNARDLVIDVRDSRQKILYLEGEPRFEVKFMRRAVEDDTQLQLVVLQRTAPEKFLRLDVDSAAELASGFPTTREELFSYRAIVLGSVEAGFFSREQLRLIEEFVGERGGSLLVLGGRRSFSEGGYAGTALEAVLPVELEERPDTTFFGQVKVTPTRAGYAHATLQLGEDAGASRQRWESLPPLSTFNRVSRLKPGATALLTGSGAGVPTGQVVLAHQRYGRGMSLALPVQDTWLWQMHADIPLEDQTHETFWRQLLRWMVADVPDQITFSTSAEPAGLTEPLSIRADLRDGGFQRINDAVVSAFVDAPDGSSREIPMRWAVQRDGEYRAGFVPEEEGVHTIRVEARRGDAQVASAHLAVDAAEDEGEFFGPEMRGTMLRRISQETGGRYYTLSTLSRLPSEVGYSGRGITRVESFDLWDMPILFLLLVALAGGEWGYRRKKGLP